MEDTSELNKSFFKNCSKEQTLVVREIPDEEFNEDEEDFIFKKVLTWTTDLTNLPPITHSHIYEYMIEATISVDNKSRGATKHKILGYQLFKEHYVQKVQVKDHVKAKQNLFLVKCNVGASMKKDVYNVYIHLDQSTAEIYYAKCTCKAGAGGCCKHVAAALYQLVDYKQMEVKSVPSDKTCTDVLQKWHVPSNKSSSNEAVLFSDLTFLKANADKDVNDSRKKPLVTGCRRFCAIPSSSFETPKSKIRKLSEDLFQLNRALPLASALKGNDYESCSFFKTSIDFNNDETSNDDPRTLFMMEFFGHFKGDLDETHLLKEESKEFVLRHLHCSMTEIINIESDTLAQSKSKSWFEHRRKRLTASKFGIVINRRNENPSDTFINSVLGTKSFWNKSCQWGLDNERKAISLYEQQEQINVFSCGFIINPKWPWLGCSPDGIISNEKAVEIKCPFSKKDLTILECCEDKNFFLKIADGKPYLKRNHNHFYQCQGVMAICELKQIDFIVYTEKSLFVENISFDSKLWDSTILSSLTKFYFEHLYDRIFMVNK